MNCPNCEKSNADSARFCIFCGSPMNATKAHKEYIPRFKGSLSYIITPEDAKSNMRDLDPSMHDKNSFPQSSHNDDSWLARKKHPQVIGSTGLKSSMGKPPSTKKEASEDAPFLYCKKCGRKLRAGEKCPICYPKPVTPVLDEEATAKKGARLWLIMAAILVLVAGIISAPPIAPSANQSGTTYEQSSIGDYNAQGTVSHNDPLSSACDFVLCVGNDKAGNKYELVANQIESSRGFEISVGVIKNNVWLFPLSTDFSFWGDAGLFHVSVDVSFLGDDAGGRYIFTAPKQGNRQTVFYRYWSFPDGMLQRESRIVWPI